MAATAPSSHPSSSPSAWFGCPTGGVLDVDAPARFATSGRRRWRWIALSAALAAVWWSSDLQPGRDPLAEPLGSARQPAAGGGNLRAVLVLDPESCLSCTPALSEWLEVRRTWPGRIQIVLSRPPSDPELRTLAAARVPIDNVLPQRALRRGRSISVGVYLLRSGNVVSADTGVLALRDLRLPREFSSRMHATAR